MGYPGPYGRQQRYTWVATPPGVRSRRPAPRRAPYLGPPAYRAVPRWGLPPLGWRVPSSVPGTAGRVPRSADRVRAAGRLAVAALWGVAISALLAAAGEVWRYVLLVLGRDRALPPEVVAVSDALVLTGAVLALVTGLVALGTTLGWLLPARTVAAARTGHVPARPDWQVLLGVLVPGLNLFLAGAVLAELEHSVLGGGPGERPKPSRPVLLWWLFWAGGEVLAVITLLWNLRTDVQGRADGVLWHAVTDLVAVGLAVLTARLVTRLTLLLGPADPKLAAFRQVLTVRDAPAPPVRSGRPAGSVR
jgi:hypothetical protein